MMSSIAIPRIYFVVAAAMLATLLSVVYAWGGAGELPLLFPFFALGGGSGGGGGGGGGGGAGSCPFLTVWNGERYAFENDILFSKPYSLFPSFADGLREYQKGLSGEAYILSRDPFDENGKMRFQIREIEPEQSYIDRLQFSTLEMPQNAVAVVDTGLEKYRAFDSNTQKPEQSSYRYDAKKGRAYRFHPEIDSLDASAEPEQGTLLNRDDELVLSIDTASLDISKPVYLVVESYYRDWMLGDQIPFSFSDQLRIKSSAFYQRAAVPLMVAGLVTAGLGAQHMNPAPPNIQSLFEIPHAHADAGHKSLIVSLQDGGALTHLATIFPRHLTPTKELVEIPASLLKKVQAGMCTLRIKATKTHKVTGAFVFQGTEQQVEETPLATTKAFHRRLNRDVSDRLIAKNEQMTSLLPGDIVDVSVKSLRKEVPEGQKRVHLLRMDGFYTPLEDRTHSDNWYKSLDADSKQILRGLRSVSYNSDRV